MNMQTLMILLDSAARTETHKPDMHLIYLSVCVIAVIAYKLIRGEIRESQSISYTQNFTKLRDVVWARILQNKYNPESSANDIINKLSPMLDAGYIKEAQDKRDVFQNIVKNLSIDETRELKQSVRKMKLPMLCRGYMIHQLNMHKRALKKHR